MSLSGQVAAIVSATERIAASSRVAHLTASASWGLVYTVSPSGSITGMRLIVNGSGPTTLQPVWSRWARIVARSSACRFHFLRLVFVRWLIIFGLLVSDEFLNKLRHSRLNRAQLLPKRVRLQERD